MRKQFNLQDWLKDKSQKVETRDGRSVKIISFEMTDTNDCPIAAQFRLCAGTPVVYLFDKEGNYKGEGNSDYDLFLVTPEEEMTDFEAGLFSAFSDGWQKYLNGEEVDMEQWAKEHSEELLTIAREQLIKNGYVIEKKAFHDAVENISDKHLAEMSVQYSIHCKVEDGTRHAIMNWDTFQKVAQKFIEIGKAEALKDLPRWKPSNCPRSNFPSLYLTGDGTAIYKDGYEISISSLEKLPKEETNL